MKALIFILLASAQAWPAALNLTDWPQDIVEQMRKEVPELNQKTFDEPTLNKILKKLDQKMQFNALKVVQVEEEMRLVGEISAVVDKIELQGLEEISDSEALTLMNLNVKNGFDEDTLKAASEKLVQFYRELGYRFAEVKFEVMTLSTIKKVIVFKINLKKQTKLTDIQVEGIDPLSKEIIERQIKNLFIKPVLNQETLNKLSTDLRRQLSLHGYYLTQVVSPQIIFSADELSARVLYKLKPMPQFSIEILNANQFPHLYIEGDILKLDTYYSKDPVFGSELVEKLKTFYVSEGYPHIDVAYYERKEGQKTVLTFNLDEGPFTRIKTLSIVGQLSKPESFYIDKFYNLASAKLNSKTFIKEDIEAAAKNLLIELQNEGFVNAHLGRLQISTDRENPKDGIVIIQLDEGPQVLIESIEFEGLVSQNRDQLLNVINLKVGEPLSLIQLEQALNNLKIHYLNQGYIEFKLTNETKDLMTYSDKNSKAHLKFVIQEGPKVEVQSILLEGNERTHDKVILTEIDFKPGDVLTPLKIDESISRLQRTGHFSSIDISTVEAGSTIALRTVLIKVVERDPGIFTIGAGATNENNGTIRGYSGVAYRNIGGWGRGLSARVEGNYNFADVKYLENKIILGGVEPYLLETRARLRLNITRSRAISDIVKKKVTELNLGVLSVEQDFTSHVTGIWDLWSVATYIDHGITPEDEIKNGYTREDLVIGSTGPTVDIDYRNNFFNPTKGSFSRFSIEYASEFLSSNNVDDFVRFNGQSTWYFPINKSALVFAQSFSGGYIQDLNQKGYGIPFDKKGFTLGGRTTIRGFGSLEFFPSSLENSSQYIGTSFKLKTFASYELVKSELRFPLVAKWDLMGAIFYDGGQVLVDGFEFTDKWRDAVGVGFRYNTPIGPLNLEYAQKLDRKEGESEGAFHLSVGVF
jgi:outer membrane protein insertion porin family